jgi:hypothetical protein
MTKTLDQIIIFFLHQNQNIVFQQHWESEYFFRTKTITPPRILQNQRMLCCGECFHD